MDGQFVSTVEGPKPGERLVNVHDPKQVAAVLSDFVNSLGSTRACEELARELVRDHRTLIQMKAGLFVRFFHEYAQLTHHDGRNQQSHELAQRLDPILDEATNGTFRFPVI